MHFFPVDVNTASMRDLLRVPGIGPTSAKRIVAARREGRLGTAELKRIGVVLKRAKYFIITKDAPTGPKLDKEATLRALIDPKIFAYGTQQLSLFDAPDALPGAGGARSLGSAVEETVLCLKERL